MFRYIGLTWDESDATASSTASRLGMALQVQPEWRPALLVPGLRVFAAGVTPGVNTAYPISGDGGVVLGKLFRVTDLDHPSATDTTLTADDGHRIARRGCRALIDDYWGRYVAFIHDKAGGTRILRDPSGTLPCFLICHHGVWIVFSWLEDVLDAMPRVVTHAVNWDCVAGYILYGELSGHETALYGVRQLVPGEVVHLNKGTENRELHWNAFDIAAQVDGAEVTAAAAKLRTIVRACAQSWASCYDNILLRLSGGVDSSILLSCLAAHSSPAQVICVNYHSAGSDSDERRYARLAAAAASRRLIERERNPNFRLESVLDVARTPTPSNYIGRMNSAMDIELAAAHGAQTMFTGVGGDQLFFELRRWWPVADYLRLRGFDAGFASAAIDAARLGRVSVWKALGLAVADLRRPAPLQEAGSHLKLVRPEALARAVEHQHRFTHPALLRATALPIGKRNQTHQLLFPIGYYDPYERHLAPELVSPLLSQPLIELCLRLPTYVLTAGGRGRALARRAFAADLPEEIATRRSKGGLEEHLAMVLRRNLDFARSMLLDGELVSHGILDRAKVEETLSDKATALATRIGEIHAHIGIEAWLRRWTNPARGCARSLLATAPDLSR